MIETDLILSVGTIFAPIIFLTIVYGIMRRLKRRSRTWTFAKRVLEGYIVFWLLYILFPAILNILNPVEDSWKQFTVFQSIGSDSLVTGVLDADLNTFVRYTGQFLANSVALYLFYPFTLFPIIFIVGPLVSFFVLWRQLRKSKGESFLSKLGQIQFALEMSPTEAVGQRLEKADWTEKKKLFFILLAVLPISLYLLMTFLKVLGYQEQSNILKGTSLGWFLEIFFAYLAIAMYGVHLLYAAKISYKGDYVGLRVRDAIFQSLSTVGTFVSAIAIILFLVDYSKQLFVVLYFIGYFVMVTVIFILFLDVFEPVSIYLLTKIIETVKRVGPTGMPVAETVTKDLSQPSMPEVFVPVVNLEELREEQPAASITTPKEEAPVSLQKQVVPTPLDISPPISEIITPVIRRRLFSISSRTLVAGLLAISLMIITSNLIAFATGRNCYFGGTCNSQILSLITVNQYAQAFAFVVLIFVFSPSIILPVFLFARKYTFSVFVAIAVHIFLIVIDLAVRNFLILFSGSLKFGTVSYLTFYFSFLYIFVIFVLGLSILLLRRFKWDPLPNISLLIITGLMVGYVWLFSVFSTPLVLPIPGVGDVMLIPNISFIFNPYGVVSPTFNTSMQALIPYLYNLSGNQNWITVIFQPTLLENSSVLLNPFLVTVPVNFAPVLGVASIPFVLFRDVSNILLFGLLFFFLGREFVTIIVQPDPKKPQLEKSIFSVTDTIPTAEEIERDTSKYFVMRNFGLEPLVDANGMPTNRPLTPLESAIYNMELGKEGELGQIIMEFTGETPISFADLGKEMQTRLKDLLSFFSFVNKTAFAREHPFTVIRREYGFGYEEAKVDSLHIMMTDGRSVFTHSFAEESSVEPALVAGLFSAITSFAKEAVKAEKLLRTIDHGDIVLIIEYGRFVFSVLFADRQTIELRSKLSKFLTDFENKHAEVLESWLGDTSYFAEDWQLVSSIFGE